MEAYIKNLTLSQNSAGYMIPIYFTPDSLSESVSSNYDQQSIPGRSAPIITYTSTGARQVSLSYVISPDYLPSGFASIKSYVTAVKALEYPKYENSLVISPNCELHLPGLDLYGVCNSVSIDYKVDRYTRNSSMAATVSLTFLEVQDYLRGSINIINGTHIEQMAPPLNYYEFQSYVKPDLVVYGLLPEDGVYNAVKGKDKPKDIIKNLGSYTVAGNAATAEVRVTSGDKVIYSGTSIEEASKLINDDGQKVEKGMKMYNVKYIPKTADGSVIDSSVVTKIVTYQPDATKKSTSTSGNVTHNATDDFTKTGNHFTDPSTKKTATTNNTRNPAKGTYQG